MGKSVRSGLGKGVGSSPQTNFEQQELDNKISELLQKEEMFNKLDSAGVKYNREDVVFVVSDSSGQLIWLEKGNEFSGLEHIKKHLQDFINKHKISPDNLIDHLKNIISKGTVLQTNKKILPSGNIGFEKVYFYNNEYYAIGAIGTNGYLVSMYPINGGK